MKRAKAALMAALILPAGGPTARVINHDRDDPGFLAPGAQIEMNLKSLDARSKRSVPQKAAPWSDVTWKANKGLVGERYNDGNYEASEGWGAKHQYLNEYSAAWVLNMDPWNRAKWIESLSPAEKYDLLLGIADDGLAVNIGSFLDQTIGTNGQFPSWWGLCEGSAPASVYYPEPTRKVVLHSEAYNLDVPFYAPDVKGLATMLWSRFNTNLNLPEAGQQCKQGSEDSCFDSNPASFHAAVHHFLDLSPGILIGEMDPSPVVWNFPIVSYSETYFRPDRGAAHKEASLAAAALPVARWATDPRRAKRSPGTAYVVGVRMNISYGVNRGQTPPLEGSIKRKINTRTLTYELELDASYKMLGGEWVSGSHPDLLWAVPSGTVPDSPAERQLPPRGGENGVIPKAWSQAAKASAARLTPLRRVVEILVKRSSGR
jgi:hypothetical protein